MRIALFITCLTDGYFPRAGIAVVRVLEHLGHDVSFPPGQTCCGQPMFNNGFHPEARRLARRMIRRFENAEAVVTPSASCAVMVREHFPPLFEAGTPARAAAETLAGRTWEFAQFLKSVLDVDLRALGVRWAGTAACHTPCHGRGLGPLDHARMLAGAVDGLTLVPLENESECCGFGGTFAVAYPAISGGMARAKAAAIEASGAGTVISSEAGCTMNIAGACRRSGAAPRFVSLAEVIAEGLGLLPREPAS